MGLLVIGCWSGWSHGVTNPWAGPSEDEMKPGNTGEGSKARWGSGAEYPGGIPSMVEAQDIQTTRPIGKMDWKWLGPVSVTCQISPYTNKLDLPAAVRIQRVQPVLLVAVAMDDPLVGQWMRPQPPVEVNGREEYDASGAKISQVNWNQLHYLIQWIEYDSLI